METVIASKEKILESYNKASNTEKKILIDIYGEDMFKKPTKITDIVKNMDDIYRLAGVKLEDLVSDKDTPDEIGYKQAKLIAKVYNEGWAPNIANTNEYKYWPYFSINSDKNESSGFGFSYYYCALTHSLTHVGFRLCFKTKELAIDAGKKFVDVYRKFMAE